MDYQVSARKYRPGTFDDVVGQGHVVQSLLNAITTKRIAHAFLFSGTRGVGKTTVARILAKALNCEQGQTGEPCNRCPICQEITLGSSVDVIEIDGASNTSVDDIREVRENIKFAPFRGRYRVYIIDEVHMLSTSAFNALLKTLEEPPAHVIFVFATTEIHKIPATILSRCQHYNFRRITRAEIVQRLQHVAKEEGIEIEDRSLLALARASEGSMRDALSLMDQAVAFSGKQIRHPDLEALLGSVPQELVHAMISAVVRQDTPPAVRVIAELLDQGHDLRAYCSDLVEYVRNLLVASVVESSQDLRGLMEVSEEDLRQIQVDAQAFTPEQLQELFRIFSQAEDSLRVSAHPRFVLEVAAVRATRLLGSDRSPTNQPSGSDRTERLPAKDQGARREPVPSGESAPRPVAQATHSAPSESAPVAPSGKRDQPATRDPQSGPAGATQATASPHQTTSAERAPTASTQTVNADAAADVGRRPAQARDSASPVKLDWEQVQERVALEYPNIGPFLERAVLVGIDGGQLTIGYTKTDTVARALIEKEDNISTLNQVCTKMAGSPVRLRVVELTDAKRNGPSPAQMRIAKAQEQKVALLDRTRSHPLVKQALDIFGGEIVEVRQGALRKEVRE